VIPLASLAGYAAQGIGYGFAAAAQPGAFQAFIISQTLQNGWRKTLPAALAPLISDGPIVVLMVAILSRLPEWGRTLLYIGGGLFILYLARGAYVAWRRYDEGTNAVAGTGSKSLAKASMMNLLSPGPYLFWGLVAGPVLVRAWSESPASGAAFLAGFYTAMIATLAGIILLFGTARRIGPRVTRGMLAVSAVVLAGFGGYQLWLGIARWLSPGPFLLQLTI
jgi:threonine/homoserine/homoserine lactone efflux protein